MLLSLIFVDFCAFRGGNCELLTRHKHEQYEQLQPMDTASVEHLDPPTLSAAQPRHRAASAPVTYPARHLRAWSFPRMPALMRE